uniref:Uncharacterized protein n=1 Tax=Trichobilharzia regenti TaxID=157069 RepID=A0AA85KEE2_TRIRE|nr:unnamed protein product [Trichobilharzia regenti]
MDNIKYNPEVRHLLNLAKFVLHYVDYNKCTDKDDSHLNKTVRQLGNFDSVEQLVRRCKRKPSSKLLPICEKPSQWWKTEGNRLYVTAHLMETIREFYHEKICRACKRKLNKNHQEVTRLSHPRKRLMDLKFSTTDKSLCQLVKDDKFKRLINNYEMFTNLLSIMWLPTRPVESVREYAVAKYAAIHYILSTHAILPSSECFTENDIQKIMHLPVEWIGGLPRKEDTRCITKFMSRFPDIFAQKIDPEGTEDPLDEYARQRGQRIFLEIIHYASALEDGETKRPHFKADAHSTEYLKPITSSEELEDLPPLDWNDQLSRPNVKIRLMPKVKKYPLPTESRFRKPVSRPSSLQQTPYYQAHKSKSFGDLGEAVKNVPPSLLANVENLQKSRALKRAPIHLLCHREFDRTARKPDTLYEQFAKDEEYFHQVVNYLPHYQYTLPILLKIQNNLLQATPEKEANEKAKRPKLAIIKTPMKSTNDIYKPNQWNPNRRAYIENPVKITDVLKGRNECRISEKYYKKCQTSVLSSSSIASLSNSTVNENKKRHSKFLTISHSAIPRQKELEDQTFSLMDNLTLWQS